MRKTVIAFAAATIAATTIASPARADAERGWWPPAFIASVFPGAVVEVPTARPYYPGPVYFEYSQPGPTYYEVYPPKFFAPTAVDPCWRGRQRVC